VRRRGPREASSKAETRPRGSRSLQRGGDSPEGALGPRARRRLTRGGVRPSSEAESRGAAPGPRARRRLARGVPWSVA
jgi:hypothetical protein